MSSTKDDIHIKSNKKLPIFRDIEIQKQPKFEKKACVTESVSMMVDKRKKFQNEIFSYILMNSNFDTIENVRLYLV
jgi:hypothetical protein